jgi:hypothetical protein
MKMLFFDGFERHIIKILKVSFADQCARPKFGSGLRNCNTEVNDGFNSLSLGKSIQSIRAGCNWVDVLRFCGGHRGRPSDCSPGIARYPFDGSGFGNACDDRCPTDSRLKSEAALARTGERTRISLALFAARLGCEKTVANFS